MKIIDYRKMRVKLLNYYKKIIWIIIINKIRIYII